MNSSSSFFTFEKYISIASQNYSYGTLRFENFTQKAFLIDDVFYSGFYLQYNPNDTLACHTRGRLAFTDSWITCAANQLPFLLETAGAGYLCTTLSLLIVVISIFGKIKENYKWFILNQALWDLLVAYDFICDKPSNRFFTQVNSVIAEKLWNQGPPKCFYSRDEDDTSLISSYINNALTDSINHIQYPMTFSLAASRFLAVYCPIFYKNKFTNVKTVIILISYNVFLIVTFNYHFINDWNISAAIKASCYCKGCNISTIASCSAGYSGTVSKLIIDGIKPTLLVLWLLLSIIFTCALLSKLLYRAKFHTRISNNKLAITHSIHIATVLVLQCLISLLFFIFIFTQQFLNNWIVGDILTYIFKVPSGTYLQIKNFMPRWILMLGDSPQCLNILRSFFESIIVLTVLTGYRRIIVLTFKRLLLLLRNPKKAFSIHSNTISAGTTNSRMGSSIIFSSDYR